MMKAPGGIAMAVRDAKGRIILDYKEYQTKAQKGTFYGCLLYTSPSPRDA